LRLNLIKSLYLNHEVETLNQNKDKIRKLVDEYETKFRDTPEYDSMLTGSIEAFIL
jgi:hypothetical protein